MFSSSWSVTAPESRFIAPQLAIPEIAVPCNVFGAAAVDTRFQGRGFQVTIPSPRRFTTERHRIMPLHNTQLERPQLKGALL